jgi:Tol biopolymer transport system component
MVQGTTIRVSVATSGTQANGPSANPILSSDGHFVAFDSTASNLVAGDTNGSSDVFVRDLFASITERVSVSGTGSEAMGMSQMPSMSSDGRYIAFASTAENLLPAPGATNQAWDVYVRDRTGSNTVCAGVSSSGAQGSGNSFAPAISADGRYVAFQSQASDLVAGDTNGRADVFVRDLQSATTTRVSVDSAGAQGNQASVHPSISGDGRYVVFASQASNLVPGDTNAGQDVFSHDCVQGTTIRLSVDSNGGQAAGACLCPIMSQDGRFVVFACDAANLASGDTNAVVDVFVRGPLF